MHMKMPSGFFNVLYLFFFVLHSDFYKFVLLMNNFLLKFKKKIYSEMDFLNYLSYSIIPNRPNRLNGIGCI